MALVEEEGGFLPCRLPDRGLKLDAHECLALFLMAFEDFAMSGTWGGRA
jgi:hypothetical protein